MMNPYELNWPGLRDVPVVTVDKEAAVIYSQENLLPLKRGKLDRLEYKYVPIEAVLDEFNAEIELEEAFETLESILDIPGVKPLYTDKTTGRKYVHVSSLLALIVLRPDDGPGFETACHSILHFLMNHLEMACLECGFIRRDCLCQVYDVCLDPKNIECVSYAKESAEKDVQTDPVKLDTFSRPSATTVYLPRGANLSNCERLPDGSLNIKYMKADGKGEVITQPQPAAGMPAGMPPPGLMLPPGYMQGAGLQAGFVPPSVPVCHTGMHPAMMTTSPYLPMTTSPLTMMSTMLPTSTMPVRPMGPPMFGGNMYPGVRAFYPNGPVITSAPCLPGPYQGPRVAMPPPPTTPPVKPNNVANKTVLASAKSKTLKRSHEKPIEVSPEPKPVSLLKKKRRKAAIVPLKEGAKEESADKPKVGRPKSITLRKVSNKKDSGQNSEKKKSTDSSKKSDTEKDSEEGKLENESKEGDEKEKKEKDGVADDNDNEMDENNTESTESTKKVEKVQLDSTDSKEEMKEDTAKGELVKGAESAPVIKKEAPENGQEMATEGAEAGEAPEEVEMAAEGGHSEDSKENTPAPVPTKKTELFVQKSPETSKGWDVFEYAPTGHQMIRCLCCGQCFDKENYAEKHNEMHTVQRTLRCLQCEYTVSAARWYTLLRHLYSKHSMAFVSADNSCKLCGNVFDTLEGLEEHVDVHHYNKYKCTYCGTSLLTWDAYQHHVAQCAQVAQGKTYYSCPYCHFAFRDRLMKQVHVKSHQDDALVCCYCRDGKDWGNWKLLKNHYELLHLPKVKDRNPKKAKACPRCSQVFKSYKGFRNHVAKCTGPKEVPKAKENETSDTESAAGKKASDSEKDAKESVDKETNGEEGAEKSDTEEKENKKGTETDNKEEEEDKDKDKDTESKITENKRTVKKRKGKGQLKCEKCHKKFGAASTLDRHMSYAHGPESKCDECDHTAKTPMLLKMHKTLKHSEKRHICSECNRTFMYYHQYKVHLAWHARKVAYACPTCDAEFPRQMELRQHQLKDHPTATNRTVFTCSACDFKCFSRTTLRAHLRNKHLSSDEEEEEEAGSERAFRPSDEEGSEEEGGDGSGDGSGTDTASSEVDEEDLTRLFSWRQSQPAPEGARRSQRTPKPSTKLKDIARTRKTSKRKKQLPSRRGRKRSTSSRRAPRSPSPSPAPMRHRRPGLKGRPPMKRGIKPRRVKKEKVEKKVKLRRCGCARFRTYAEFKILKKRMEEKRIVETTIIEDATLPMRRRTVSNQSEPEVCRPPRAEVPEASWTFDQTLTSLPLSVEQRERLGVVVLDHCYYQKPGPPERPKTPDPVVVSEPVVDAPPAETDAVSPARAAAGAGRGRKRLLSASGGGTAAAAAAATTGQSPAKVRATVNDLESAIKFADNINQLSKLVSILRADKEELPAGTTFLQSPPRGTRLVSAPSAQGSGAGGGSHPTPNRPSAGLDYEIGDIEPLPSDIMASEMESDIDMQGVMSEILEEMGQNTTPGDDSGVSADVSQAAEVLLSLDMSAEERELVADLAPTPAPAQPPVPSQPAPVLVATAEEYVHPGRDLLQEAIRTTGALENGGEGQEEELGEEQEDEAELQVDDEEEGAEVEEEVAGDSFVIKTVPLTTPKVAVEMTNVNIPHSDFLFWAAKHDDTDDQPAEPTEGAEDEPAQAAEPVIEQTTWQLDHQYF